MSDAPLRAAVIGCGRMGVFTADRVRQTAPAGSLPLSHADVLASLDSYELAALCDQDKAQLKNAGDYCKVTSLFTDHREMLEQVQPDVVCIATRTEGRCRIIADAAKAGVKGIHAEKPVARSVAEWREAMAELILRDVKFTYGALRRWNEIYDLAFEKINSGEYGDLLQISVEFGPSMLFWTHSHSVDLLINFAGSPPLDVQAACRIDPDSLESSILDQDPVVEQAVIRFENGVIGSITSTAGMNLRMGLENGMVTVLSSGAALEIRSSGDMPSPYHHIRSEETHKPSLSSGQHALMDLAKAIRTGERTRITLEEIEWGQRILTGIVISSVEGGRRIDLDEVPEDFVITGRFGNLYA